MVDKGVDEPGRYPQDSTIAYLIFEVQSFVVFLFLASYFNYRTTRYLTEQGFYQFHNWFDDRAWYPLGRIIGGTIYPGQSVMVHGCYISVGEGGVGGRKGDTDTYTKLAPVCRCTLASCIHTHTYMYLSHSSHMHTCTHTHVHRSHGNVSLSVSHGALLQHYH